MKKVLAGVVIILALLAGLATQLFKIEHSANGRGSATFTLECDFNRFRQIMVRKNATEAIVNHGGMTLLSAGVQDLKIDTSDDDRPVLNAILGRSKAELDATKTLTLRINEAAIEAKELTLRQVVDAGQDHFKVETASMGEQSDIERYSSTVIASPIGNSTRVELVVEMTVNVEVPKLFVSRADAEVQQAASKAVTDQQTAITKLIVDHADESLILPEL